MGDARGFDTLFRADAAAIVGYLRGRGVRDPDDLANEVFVRAFRNIHTVRGDAARYRSWLFSIARNASIDDARRRQRRARETPLDAEVHAVGGDVEAEAISHLERTAMRAMLDELAPDQRDVLLLRVVGDLSIEQTAAVVDKSYEAVKALQRRGIAALRRKLVPPVHVPQ
ncbi:MAG TPA: RNA polymerase sigma factor [Acidimicrobiia bacterium]|jgi:RNA polymerase sigma-70 factor (ECF subfamily)|nr:RNA polymerase sigma factor [Acidimicrobiia bacterium]